MSYASLTEAKEAVGGHVRSVLEITLTDKASNRPTGDWWTETKTLHLCGGEAFLRTDTSSTDGFMYYEPLVKDWGEIVQECQIGQAFGNIADTQIILHNRKLAAQQNNSTYTFSAGSASADPEPDMVQLAEMFQFYNFLSATVVIKVFFFSGTDTDQGTAGNFTSRTIFNGFIQDVDIGSDITLDITQDTTMQDTTLPGRILSDSIDKNIQTLRAPIVYGNFFEHFESTGSADEVNGLPVPSAVAAGLFQPTVVAGVPWKRDPDHPIGDATYLFYMYNDVRGRNDGWEFQSDTQKDASDDTTFIHDTASNVWTIATLGTPPGSSGEVFWPAPTNPEELVVTSVDYIEGKTYIPCDSIYDEGDISTGSATTLINPENMFDGDPFTYAEFPLDNDNYVDLRIRQVSPLGSVVNEADAIVGYIVVDTSAVTGSPDPSVRFGTFRPNDAADVSYRKWIGSGDNNSDYGDDQTTYGDLDSSGGSFAKGIYDQGALNDTDIPASHFYGNVRNPAVQWDWKHPERAADTPGGVNEAFAELVVRIEVENQGGAGETLKIIAAGLVVKNIAGFTEAPRAVSRRVQIGTAWGKPVYHTFTFTEYPSPSDLVVHPWVMPSETTLDHPTDTYQPGDGAPGPGVSIEGTVDGPLTAPAAIAAHLLVKWGDGVSDGISGDVNYDNTSVSQGSPFGSAYWADAEWNTWRLGGTSNHCQLVIDREQTMGEALDEFMGQFPIMLYREVGDDQVKICSYPEDATDTNRFYSGSTAVKFHPNIDHPDAGSYGKPYVVQDLKIKLTPLGAIFNRFKLRYRRFAPTGDLSQGFTITETPNDSNVLDTATNLNDAKTNTLPGGYDPSAVCRVSQERYGVSQWMTIDAPSLHSHDVAYAFMHYLLKRFTQPRVIVEATCGPEAVDLKPGHLIGFSDDLNLSYPVPDYGSQAAKISGWAYTGETGDPHKDFIVQRINRRPEDYGCETTFTSEQIMFNPRGTFWAPSDVTGTITEHLEADAYSGSDGDAVATWTATVGTNATQGTAANKPTYQSDVDSLQNEMGIMRWADNTDAFNLTSFTAPSGNYVMAAVLNMNATANTQTLYRSETGSPIVQIANGSTLMSITDGGGAQTFGAPTTGKQVLLFSLDATNGSGVFRDGTSTGTGTYTADTPGGTQHVGNRHPGAGGQGIDADLYEFLIITYSGAVDTADLTKLEGYLAHKWGLEANLPVSHAYRYSPPTTG